MESVKRADGRSKTNEIRKLSVEYNVLKNTHGSCRYSQGNSQILCGIYGPLELKTMKEHPHKSLVQVSFKPKSGYYPLAQHKEFESILQGTLESVVMVELYPRGGVLIVIQVIEDDGSILSAALNASILALIDAGISMRSTLCSVTCAVSKGDEQKLYLLLDPSKLEEQSMSTLDDMKIQNNESFIVGCKGWAFFVFDPNNSEGLISSLMHGSLSEEELWQCITIASKACKSVSSFMRLTLDKKIKNTFEQ